VLLARQLAYHLALKLSTSQKQGSFKPIASLVGPRTVRVMHWT